MVANKKIDCKFCETTSSKINILKILTINLSLVKKHVDNFDLQLQLSE